LTKAFELKDLDPTDLRNNKLHLTDRAFHDWYRFVLSFPPHLVRYYFDRFNLDSNKIVLDPFCGTGTTIVEAKKGNLRDAL
jgi:tRNA G10  N-methylase Trm11